MLFTSEEREDRGSVGGAKKQQRHVKGGNCLATTALFHI